MSFTLHDTDEVFAELRGLCSNSYRMYDPSAYRYYYDHECDAYECAVDNAAEEYERLLAHCNHQREQLARYERDERMDERTKTEYDGVGSSKVLAGSSITDELRDCIRTASRSYEDVRSPYNDREILHIPDEELIAIADRIDAAHRKALEKVAAMVDEPDSWKRIIQDAVKLGYADYPTTYQEAELVERCKRLAGAK